MTTWMSKEERNQSSPSNDGGTILSEGCPETEVSWERVEATATSQPAIAFSGI